MANRVLRAVKTVRPVDQFLTNSTGRSTVTAVTSKTHFTPIAGNVKPLDVDTSQPAAIMSLAFWIVLVAGVAFEWVLR